MLGMQSVAEAEADLAALVGSALRQARVARGWTLEDVGARAGLSAAFLSRLERGKVSSSLSSLIRLSGALDVSLESLLASDRRGQARSGYLVRRGVERGLLSGGAYRYKPLAGGLPHHSVWVFELEYPPGKVDEFDAYSHEGEEVLYVLSGEIAFAIDGERISLRAGDCVQFDARQPHGGGNQGTVPAMMLMIFTGRSAPHDGMSASSSGAGSKVTVP